MLEEKTLAGEESTGIPAAHNPKNLPVPLPRDKKLFAAMTANHFLSSMKTHRNQTSEQTGERQKSPLFSKGIIITNKKLESHSKLNSTPD